MLDAVQLEADFRQALSQLAADILYSRDDVLIEPVSMNRVNLGWPELQALMALAVQWERCSERCDFSDLFFSALPTAPQVIEIIGELQTLIALLGEFCAERNLAL